MNTKSDVWLLIRHLLELGVEARSTRDGLGVVATEGGSTLHVSLEGSEAAVAVRRRVREHEPGKYIEFDLSLQVETREGLAAELVEYLRGEEVPPGKLMD